MSASTTCTPSATELAERLSAQAMLATAFQSVFGVEPSADQLAALNNPALHVAFRMTGLDEGDSAADARAFFALVADRSEKAIEHLRSLYTRLFIGPARLPAPPWESVYRGEDRLLLQRSTLEVRALYRSLGTLPTHYPAVADDHVALELSFLHLASQRALDALLSGAEPNSPALSTLLGAMDEIINGHLLTWLPRFSDALNGDDPRGYYAVSARLLVRFIQACSRLLDETWHTRNVRTHATRC